MSFRIQCLTIKQGGIDENETVISLSNPGARCL
jgi:hypothetical protein